MSEIQRLLDRKAIWPITSDDKARLCTWCGAGQDRMRVCDICGARYCRECGGDSAVCPTCVVLGNKSLARTQEKRECKPRKAAWISEEALEFIRVVLGVSFIIGAIIVVVTGFYMYEFSVMVREFREVYTQKQVIASDLFDSEDKATAGYVVAKDEQGVECYTITGYSGSQTLSIKPCGTATYLVSGENGIQTLAGPNAPANIVDAYYKAAVPSYRGYALGD